MARLETTLPEKTEVDGGAIRCQHILDSHFISLYYGDQQTLFARIPPVEGYHVKGHQKNISQLNVTYVPPVGSTSLISC